MKDWAGFDFRDVLFRFFRLVLIISGAGLATQLLFPVEDRSAKWITILVVLIAVSVSVSVNTMFLSWLHKVREETNDKR